ncbi:SusC/RagA family TonB-linked outer membrane protein [uncultured Duncaniella sp.]|uniref:SusC/RagA family TonB-linked outer membrane protein n=2 Tax=uncultured Duncaniella sp. TaxID=2768039 RepID=UPI0027378A17|nr:SusC/RagA family TonB-linked outer membrane protein [uncultured Duncaniella sp.]
MSRKVWLAAILTLCFSFPALAQKITVSGTVIDPEGEPLIGASVLVRGETLGTATNIDGEYTISVPSDGALVFSYVGYATQEIPVNGQSVINVTMNVNSEVLGEVVAIGYGTVKKSDATGSVAVVKPDEIEAGLATSVQDMLVGQTPGVVVTTSGGPEGSGTIRIRGGSSLNASNDPLIVVDGVPLSNDGVQGMGNSLSMIAPDNIESMTILKDASATAIYGSRASNGVIIITTKKGIKGTPEVSFSANMYVNKAQKRWNVLDANSFRAMMTNVYGAGSNEVNALGNANTDWQDEVLRTTVSSDYNLSVRGSAGMLPYRVSVTYTNSNGILKTSKMDRLTFGFNLNPKFFNDHLSVSTRVRDKNFMIFNQAKDNIEYWAAFQGRLIYLYSLVLLIPEDKLPV